MVVPNQIPRGRPKSGRVWRDPGGKSGNRIAVAALKKPWSKRLLERAEKKAVKEFERELRETAEKEKEERKKKAEEKRKRKLENERKGEVVQKITNAAKLKRLKKKQLRNIVKR